MKSKLEKTLNIILFGIVQTQLIKTNLEVWVNLGLTVRAVVCDQGSNNRAAFKHLGATAADPVLKLNSLVPIVGIFDPPHLIKSFRNALLTSDIKSPDGTVSWKVIRALYKLEIDSVTRMCPRLTDNHENPGHFDQMKVKLASQVFSQSVVARLKTVYELNKFLECVKQNTPATWAFFEKVDKLFDCLNSKCLFDGNQFRSALQHHDKSVPFKFLTDMIDYIGKIKLSNGKKVFSFDGMVQTIRGVLFVSKALSDENIPYLMTSRLNQDALENTFSLVRSANGNNSTPSV